MPKKAHFSKWAGRLETLPLILGTGCDVSYQVGLPDADSLIAQNDVPRMERWESPYLSPRRNSFPHIKDEENDARKGNHFLDHPLNYQESQSSS